MDTYYITEAEIEGVLEKAGNHFMSVQFKKKTTGEIRLMTGRLKVVSRLAGGESTIKHHENLVSFWDSQAQQYRCFGKDSVIKMRINGDTYRVIKESSDD